jgi:hypothetical protein
LDALRVLIGSIVGEAVEIPPQLAALHPDLRAVRYRRGGLPTRIGGWALGASSVAAITLWRTVWLAPGTDWTAELLLHELRHVQQFEASLTFPIRYVWESVRRGYDANQYEVDARRYAATRLRDSGAHPPTQDV